MRVYLDNCCFNRPYDDLSSETVRLEAEAKLIIQDLIQNDSLDLVWSFVLSLENDENFDDEKRLLIAEWQAKSCQNISASESAEQLARKFENLGIKSKDAAHLACAVEGKADFFITTDRKLISKAKQLSVGIAVINPLDFIAVLEGKDEK